MEYEIDAAGKMHADTAINFLFDEPPEWKCAYHGTNTYPLGKMFNSADATYKVEPGPSTAQGARGIYCEGERRRGHPHNYAIHVPRDACLEQILSGVLLHLTVDRRRRAHYPKETVNDQWC